MTLVLDIEVKSSNQETILELHLIFTIKGVTHALLGLIWYHSEPSDVPYSPNQFLALEFVLPLLTARLL